MGPAGTLGDYVAAPFPAPPPCCFPFEVAFFVVAFFAAVFFAGARDLRLTCSPLPLPLTMS